MSTRSKITAMHLLELGHWLLSGKINRTDLFTTLLSARSQPPRAKGGWGNADIGGYLNEALKLVV